MSLSGREREVLLWAAEGKTASETAAILNLSTSAVNLYASRAMLKLRSTPGGDQLQPGIAPAGGQNASQ